jgi:hypothetical protein
MSSRLLLPVALVLAACGTPQERCINGVTRDLRIVTALIEETELNLARGYQLEDYTVIRTAWVPCAPPVIITQPNGTQQVVQPAQMCMDDYEDTVQRPRAIDPVAERNKLKGLQERQRALSKQAEPAIAQCRTLYPQ